MIEPLAFTVCKLELRGKAIVLQSRSRCTTMGKTKWKRHASPKQKKTKEQVPQLGLKEAHIVVVNKGQNEKKKNVLPQNKNTPGTRFGQ